MKKFEKIWTILFVVVLGLVFLPKNVFAEVATVSSDMTNDEILAIINENNEIYFTGGTYQGLNINLDGTSSEISKKFIATGDVTFQSITNNDSAIKIAGTNMVTLNFEGNFNITGYRDNIFVNNNAKLTINVLDNAMLSLTNAQNTEQNHGNGIWAAYNTTLNINGYTNSSFIASSNAITGINVLGNSTAILKFNNSKLVDMSNNIKSSGYHAGMDGRVTTEITFNNVSQVRMNNNGWDAINFQTGDYSRLNIINCKDVELKGNSGWGTNGGDLYFENSNINASDNANFSKGTYNSVADSCSNLYAFSFTSINSVVDASNAGIYNGIWVSGNSVIKNSTITANGNGALLEQKPYEQPDLTKIPEGGFGIYFGGIANIANSTITTVNNTNGGIYFRNAKNSENISSVVGSKIVANNNGPRVEKDGLISYNSQIALLTGTVRFNSNSMYLDANGTDKPNIGLGFTSSTNKATYIVDGITVGAISSDDWKIVGLSKNDKTIVISGSLQTEENMSGDYSNTDEWNTVKLDDEVYVAPINNDGTKLVRFDLNKEINIEVNGDVNQIIYFDPNTKTKYVYDFRYNEADEDLNGEGDNAYVWTPVSIVNYDSTQGIIKYGNSTAGELVNGSSITNQKNNGTADRYTKDITVFGNSLDLAEKTMPAAYRKGYKFLGWYIPEYKNWDLAAKYAKEGNFEELYKLLTIPFTSSTKVLSDLGDITTGVEEINIYAKWGKAYVNVHYVDKNTGLEIADMDVLEGLVGEEYLTSAKTISGYTYVADSGNTNGLFEDDLTTVIYYYVKAQEDFGKGGDGFDEETNKVEVTPPQTGITDVANKKVNLLVEILLTISISCYMFVKRFF